MNKMNNYPKFLDLLFDDISIIFYVQKRDNDLLLLSKTIMRSITNGDLELIHDMIDEKYLLNLISSIEYDNQINSGDFYDIFDELNYDNHDKIGFLLFTNCENEDRNFQLIHSIDKDKINDDTIIFIFYQERDKRLSNIIINNQYYLEYSELLKIKGTIRDYI